VLGGGGGDGGGGGGHVPPPGTHSNPNNYIPLALDAIKAFLEANDPCAGYSDCIVTRGTRRPTELSGNPASLIFARSKTRSEGEKECKSKGATGSTVGGAAGAAICKGGLPSFVCTLAGSAAGYYIETESCTARFLEENCVKSGRKLVVGAKGEIFYIDEYLCPGELRD
jgi:hypothetical protein